VGCGRKAPDDTTTTTATGTTTTTSTSTTTTLSPSAPILLSPPNLARTNHSNVFLVWDPPSVETDSIVSYEVTFSTTHEFTPSETIITTQGAITSWETGILIESNYFWTVRAKASNEVWGDQSVPWRFLVDFTSPEAPTLIRPIGNEATNEARPIFSWNAVPDVAGIATYEVTIDSVVDGMVIGSITTYEPVSNLANGAHSWKVRAKDRANNWGTFSSTETFSIDLTPPSIESCSPTNGATSISRTPSTILVVFSKTMEAATINSSTFHVSSINGGVISGEVSYAPTTRTLTFTPNITTIPYYDYNATYVCSIDASVRDYVGNTFGTTASFQFSTISPAQYVNQNVDTTGNCGEYTSLAIDNDDICHISYYASNPSGDGWLRYATGEASHWTTFEVDAGTGVGQYSSIGVGNSGNVYISYYDLGNTNLKIASMEAGSLTWIKSAIDSTSSDVGKYTSLAIQGDNPSVTYYDTTLKKLKFTTKGGGSWPTSYVESLSGISEGEWASLDINSNGQANVSFYDATDACLKYAIKELSSDWTVTTVDASGAVGQYSSLSVDSNDKIHISYGDATDAANISIKYATNISSSWETVTAVSSVDCQGTSIAVTPSRNVYIAWYDNDNGNVMLASNASGSWETSTIDSSFFNVGRWLSLKLDSTGCIHVTYYNRDPKDLMYSRSYDL